MSERVETFERDRATTTVIVNKGRIVISVMAGDDEFMLAGAHAEIAGCTLETMPSGRGLLWVGSSVFYFDPTHVARLEELTGLQANEGEP